MISAIAITLIVVAITLNEEIKETRHHERNAKVYRKKTFRVSKF
jgi:hypothetical protein